MSIERIDKFIEQAKAAGAKENPEGLRSMLAKEFGEEFAEEKKAAEEAAAKSETVKADEEMIAEAAGEAAEMKEDKDERHAEQVNGSGAGEALTEKFDEYDAGAVGKLRQELGRKSSFKNAMRGYDKKDVDKYIGELIECYSSAVSEMNEKYSTLETENKDMARELAELKKENRALRKDYINNAGSSAESKKERLLAEADSIRRIIAGLKDTNIKLVEENKRYRAVIAEIRAHVSSRYND